MQNFANGLPVAKSKTTKFFGYKAFALRCLSEMKEEKKEKQALNLEELDKVNGGFRIYVDTTVHTCPECSRKFYYYENYKQHLKEVHGYK